MIGEAVPALTAWGAVDSPGGGEREEEDQGESNHNFVLHGHDVLLSKPRSSSGQL
jgi:hypothetical protein